MCFIYVVFFGMHGEALQSELQAIENNEWIYGVTSWIGSVAHAAALKKIEAAKANDSAVTVPHGQQIPKIQEIATTTPVVWAPENTTWRTFFSVQELFRPDEVDDSGIIDIEWTWKWDGYMKRLDGVGLLWNEEYILKNMDNTHFVFLKDIPVNFISAIKAKWGNVVEFSWEKTINDNQLFGDKVRVVTLPEYQNIKVLLIVFFGEDMWFLQVDHDIFEDRKESLWNAFDARYDR